MGFEDDFTLVPYRGKLAADGPRYKALGNSMAVPVVAWIGKRIAMVDRILAALRENPALANELVDSITDEGGEGDDTTSSGDASDGNDGNDDAGGDGHNKPFGLLEFAGVMEGVNR